MRWLPRKAIESANWGWLARYTRRLSPTLVRITGPGGVYFDVTVRAGRVISIPPESHDDRPDDPTSPNIRRFLDWAPRIPRLFDEAPALLAHHAHLTALVGRRSWQQRLEGEPWLRQDVLTGAVFDSQRDVWIEPRRPLARYAEFAADDPRRFADPAADDEPVERWRRP